MNARTMSRKRTWTCWAGDMSALQALGRVVLGVADQRRRELVEQRKTDLVATLNSFDEEVARVIREFEADPDGGLNLKAKDLRRRKVLDVLISEVSPTSPGEVLKQISEYEVKRDNLKDFEEVPIEDIVELTVIDKYEEVFGKIPSVTAEMDRRSTQSVRFLADDSQSPSKTYRRSSEWVTDGVYLRLGPKSASPFGTDLAVYLEVTSPSAGWTRAAFASICDEIEKGVPKWSFMRRPFWRFFLGISYFYVPWVAIMLAIEPEPAIWSATIWLPTIAVLLSAVSGITNRLTDWLFPPFEITQDGAQPSGTRRLGILASLFVTIPVGVFVNHIS
ncbi:hypothetical protein O7614_04995 [Micromonospora sp. WMMD961]|uniref:hypothetical protein n=1 Tax=Micromonospora sp. WMMD961 TaxID=3016100 RepID=UPI002416645C|nr:hypothetical protein [Micromonospora sp. WMMD961]MDG4779001.1 hypothetical protein [Micromonospora sp. WMMD961]